MIRVITQTTAERNKDIEKKTRQFLELYYNSRMPLTEIYKKLGISYKNQYGKHIKKLLKQRGANNDERRWKIEKGEWSN